MAGKLIYDIEVYPNFFLVYALNEAGEEKYWIKGFGIDQTQEILAYFNERTLIGFNSRKYDDCIIGVLRKNPKLTPAQIHMISSDIIEQGNYYKYKSDINSIDLLEILREGYNIQPLKILGVILKAPTIKDLPFNPGKSLSRGQADEVITYCRNDLDLTERVYKAVSSEIEVREQLTEMFGTDMMVSKSKIGKKIFAKYYIEETGANVGELYGAVQKSKDIPFTQILHDVVGFKTKPLQDWLDRLKTKDIELVEELSTKDTFSLDTEDIVIGDVDFSFGIGGLHSKDPAGIFQSDEEYIIVDIDAGSQYPMSLVNYNIYPKHLDKEAFLKVTKDTVTKRFEYKKRRKENKFYDTMQYGLKIALNTIIGLMNSKTFWLFCPEAFFQVTINNQLMLLMLVEDLVENGFEVLSANTDGITTKVRREDKGRFDEVVKEWEKLTKFQMEEAVYEKYIRRDVNNYLVEFEGGGTKTKGVFAPAGNLTKGFKHPIVTKAITDYFLSDVPIKETIYKATSIHDFIITSKINNKFKAIEAEIDVKVRTVGKTGKALKHAKFDTTFVSKREVQKTNRYIAVTPNKLQETANGYEYQGKSLYKVAKDNEERMISFESNQCLQECNHIESDAIPDNLDHMFYIKLAEKEIKKITNN